MIFTSDHHLVPKCRGGKEKLPICCDCHRTIHAFFSNKQLEKEYNTVDSLLADERMKRAIAWLSKQDPSKRNRMKTSNKKPRGRNG
jgi:hypothetical protein